MGLEVSIKTAYYNIFKKRKVGYLQGKQSSMLHRGLDFFESSTVKARSIDIWDKPDADIGVAHAITASSCPRDH